MTPDERETALATMAWSIGRRLGDVRMMAQEKGGPVAYPDPEDTVWRCYVRHAEAALDALLAAGFKITAPSVFTSS